MSSDTQMAEANGTWEGRWDHLDKLLLRGGPKAVEGFQPCQQLKDFLLQNVRVLIIGAGGLGCELLKDLALMGFQHIDVIDMDTIDLSNLNRQFLFRQEDVGKSKALCAAAFVEKRVPGTSVTPHNCMIQEKDDDFYRQFQIVVSGLDSIDARRWMNSKLMSLVQFDADNNIVPGTQIPFIDGGSEGLKGQARVIVPGMTACFECTLDTFPPQVNFPWCTIANTPRKPEHCIMYVKEKLWGEEFGERDIDTDSVTDVKWVMEKAIERANEFNIKGVTFRLTQGVLKNVIPAVASTNALVSAACANEAFKMCTMAASNLDNWMMYVGDNALYTYTFKYEKKDNCPVCGGGRANLSFPSNMPLKKLAEYVAESADFQLKEPDFKVIGGKMLYMPGVLAKQTAKNLEKPLSELFESGSELIVSDPGSLPGGHFKITINFTEPSAEYEQDGAAAAAE